MPIGGAPPAPVPPAVITREPSGGATIRAVRIDVPLRVDGVLDEDAYSTVEPISDFIQFDPRAGEIAIEKTDLWLLFDDEFVYVTCRYWETRPDRIIANVMRRDSSVLFGGNDNLVVNLNTFYDRRNGMMFGVNPIGGRNDGQSLNGQQYSGDFNPVWGFQVGRFEQGWTVKMAIPFKSLRYPAGREQVWGMTAVRQSKWKNEVSFITKMPPARGHRAILETSLGATVVGLEAPTRGPIIEIKPYLISRLTHGPANSAPARQDLDGDVGLDVKYGVTQTLTADVTYNTDFAQVEADEQQINWTQFSLFFPEKRELFLENQGTFSFGGVATSGSSAGRTDAPILFYSRRIGLDACPAIPIQAGGRVTGRVGRVSLGALDIRSNRDDATGIQPTNFAVLRLKSDILRKSSVGALFTHRSHSESHPGANNTFVLMPRSASSITSFSTATWPRRATRGRHQMTPAIVFSSTTQAIGTGCKSSTCLSATTSTRRLGSSVVTTCGVATPSFASAPVQPQVTEYRKYAWTGSLAYVEDGAGRLETREADGEFSVEFQSSDRFSIGVKGVYEFLPVPFPIATTVTLPVGSYDYATARIGYEFGRQRSASGNVLLESGTFYDGRRP